MKNGFAAISVVLILSVVVISIATTVALLSIGEGQATLSLFKGEDNLSFVEGCMEDAILKIRANTKFAGTTITRPEGTCNISYITSYPNWDITATPSTTLYQRKVEAKFSEDGYGITMTSWREI